jgi:hypothetical protein
MAALGRKARFLRASVTTMAPSALHVKQVLGVCPGTGIRLQKGLRWAFRRPDAALRSTLVRVIKKRRFLDFS